MEWYDKDHTFEVPRKHVLILATRRHIVYRIHANNTGRAQWIEPAVANTSESTAQCWIEIILVTISFDPGGAASAPTLVDKPPGKCG